jgi:hypothetical protein
VQSVSIPPNVVISNPARGPVLVVKEAGENHRPRASNW